MRLRLISICQQFSIHIMDFRNSCSIICTNIIPLAFGNHIHI